MRRDDQRGRIKNPMSERTMAATAAVNGRGYGEVYFVSRQERICVHGKADDSLCIDLQTCGGLPKSSCFGGEHDRRLHRPRQLVGTKLNLHIDKRDLKVNLALIHVYAVHGISRRHV